jgi:hypothetical protein
LWALWIFLFFFFLLLQSLEERDRSPWNISPSKLHALVLPLAKRFHDAKMMVNTPELVGRSNHHDDDDGGSPTVDWHAMFRDVAGIRCR